MHFSALGQPLTPIFASPQTDRTARADLYYYPHTNTPWRHLQPFEILSYTISDNKMEWGQSVSLPFAPSPSRVCNNQTSWWTSAFRRAVSCNCVPTTGSPSAKGQHLSPYHIFWGNRGGNGSPASSRDPPAKTRWPACARQLCSPCSGSHR